MKVTVVTVCDFCGKITTLSLSVYTGTRDDGAGGQEKMRDQFDICGECAFACLRDTMLTGSAAHKWLRAYRKETGR